MRWRRFRKWAKWACTLAAALILAASVATSWVGFRLGFHRSEVRVERWQVRVTIITGGDNWLVSGISLVTRDKFRLVGSPLFSREGESASVRGRAGARARGRAGARARGRAGGSWGSPSTGVWARCAAGAGRLGPRTIPRGPGCGPTGPAMRVVDRLILSPAVFRRLCIAGLLC